MNLMDALMDEFKDEAKISQMEDRETMSWLEVSISLKFITFDWLLHFTFIKITNNPYLLQSEKDFGSFSLYKNCKVIPFGKS